MPRPSRRLFLTASAASLLLPTWARAAPKARLINDRWRTTGTAAEPDHGAWDAILARHVQNGTDGITRFAYDHADRTAIADYITQLLKTDPTTLTSAAGFAYWVNLYNALTVTLVLGAWPVASIRDIGGTLFSPGPWKRKLLRVADTPLSLDDIEHGILRPVWQDPRLHYAVNCAALGCPNLASRAYTAGRLDSMLEAGARAYVNHPRGAHIRDGGLITSKIYEWFQADFGGSQAGVIAHLQGHANEPLKPRLTGLNRIADTQYDWRLNG